LSTLKSAMPKNYWRRKVKIQKLKTRGLKSKKRKTGPRYIQKLGETHSGKINH